MLRQREDLEMRLSKIRAKEKAERERHLRGDQAHKKRKIEGNKPGRDLDDEEQFILDDYESDREQSGPVDGISTSGLSSTTIELMEKLGVIASSRKEEESEIEDEIKVSDTPILTFLDVL